ncbi:protein kinase domain-containing protein [Deinococcus radiodurans]|uniref:protein kinase domain-containing protein n=1 Tax=Deinococcus radiodurans TaxID=1299 RepID=UPI00140FBBC7|nr:hypothetical protein HAV35_11235 [Deinococcus radiodurans]
MAEWPEQGARRAGRYLLDEQLHSTPHEALYRAHTEWNEQVLVSFYAVADPGTPRGQRARQTWLRYARSLLQVHSPHVLPVRDLIDEGEWLSLVFEPRRTITLRELLSAGPVSPELLQPLTTALFEGLSAAHQGALLHTQISPEAVWFDTQKRPLLAEFGLARRTAQELRDHWPHDPRYAAPELLSGALIPPRRICTLWQPPCSKRRRAPRCPPSRHGSKACGSPAGQQEFRLKLPTPSNPACSWTRLSAP